MPRGNKNNTKYMEVYCDRCKKVTRHLVIKVGKQAVEAICEKCKPCI